MDTLHAPAARRGTADLARQTNYFREQPLLQQAFDATNAMLLVVNDCRQVVYANKAFRQQMDMRDVGQLFGQRPGEIIGCPHADEDHPGCGTSLACQDCGAVNLMLQAMLTQAECSGEAILTSHSASGDVPLQFMMQVVPIHSTEDSFYVVSFVDASDQARRRALEKVFFHDITNTAGALQGILGLLKTEAPAELQTDLAFVEKLFGGLVEEILAQKQLLEAESKELIVNQERFLIRDLLVEVQKLYEWHTVARKKKIIIDSASDPGECISDIRLLKRVVGNMLKNALEASVDNGCVRLGCGLVGPRGDDIRIWVHNDGYMEPKVQHRIFQRSFSTKGVGRGLGTYGIKLLGEQYLGGKVDFISDLEKGTTFFIVLPGSRQK